LTNPPPPNYDVPMKTWNRRVLLVTLVLAGACSKSIDFEPVYPPDSPQAMVASWQQSTSPVVENRGGLPILEEEIALLLEGQPDLPREQAIQRIHLRKALALKTLENDPSGSFRAVAAWRSALARRHVEVLLTEKYTPDSVPMDVWKQVYSDRAIFLRFDHAELHRVVDIQIICCRGGTPDGCTQDPQVQSCKQRHMEDMRQIHLRLTERAPRSKEEFVALGEELRTEFPRAIVKEYSFYYDYAKPHSKQRGYNILDENVVQAAKKAGLNAFSEPVESFAGLHLLYVHSHEPETRMKFEDPETLRILKEEFFPQVRNKFAMDYLRDIASKYQLQMDEEAINEANWKDLTGFRL